MRFTKLFICAAAFISLAAAGTEYSAEGQSRFLLDGNVDLHSLQQGSRLFSALDAMQKISCKINSSLCSGDNQAELDMYSAILLSQPYKQVLYPVQYLGGTDVDKAAKVRTYMLNRSNIIVDVDQGELRARVEREMALGSSSRFISLLNELKIVTTGSKYQLLNAMESVMDLVRELSLKSSGIVSVKNPAYAIDASKVGDTVPVVMDMLNSMTDLVSVTVDGFGEYQVDMLKASYQAFAYFEFLTDTKPKSRSTLTREAFKSGRFRQCADYSKNWTAVGVDDSSQNRPLRAYQVAGKQFGKLWTDVYACGLNEISGLGDCSEGVAESKCLQFGALQKLKFASLNVYANNKLLCEIGRVRELSVKPFRVGLSFYEPESCGHKKQGDVIRIGWTWPK